ncbi:CDP-diacylglycerol---serine O-phosphatidyltransferase [Parelusimicrobium proximum]|uniref:CDP-diacylglycerol--serine O-phosphatidyltransferase n=1 Tax=Parelusimicrobium proximum TaxID=3228953 RepID=UPI003D17C4BB
MEDKNKPSVVQKIKKTGRMSVPSLFTIANMACGFFAILAAVGGNYLRAGWLILIAMVFDAFDGRVARMLKAESNFGIEIDSLADTVSFCVAPALLMYYMALNGTPFGSVIAFIYALCGVLRLAKFNSMAHEGKSSKQHFSGLPVPAPAAILASFAISYSIFLDSSAGSSLKPMAVIMPRLYSVIAFVMIALGLLMVSTIPYAAFKSGGDKDKKMKLSFLLLLAIIVYLLIRFPQDVVFIVMSLYVLFGIVMVFFRAFRNLKD